MQVLNLYEATNVVLIPPHFLSFHCIHFAVNQVKNQGFVSIEALMQGSYGVPEGQPQCKSSPLRKEIQDVALKESRTVCVCVHNCEHCS